MSAFRKLFTAAILLLLAVCASANLMLSFSEQPRAEKEYRVEISRLSAEIAAGHSPDTAQCKYVTAVTADTGSSNFWTPDATYAVREINGTQYRFDYRVFKPNSRALYLTFNGVWLLLSLTVIGILLFIRSRLLKPFEQFSAAPAELAKGNLTAPLPESRSRFFGKFVWGVNMLRETLEQGKARELELWKKQQTLVLSVSHDIKTPLSAIKLYTKALEKGLYTDEAKRTDTIKRIGSNADEIEHYVSDLTKNASEDFLDLPVENNEFYLSQLMHEIESMYPEKFLLQKMPLTIVPYGDCLLFGDLNRSIEVMQNLLENALKYGGGAVEIRCADEEDCRLVTVANAGCTLPESEALHMFDSFWRGSNAEGKNGSGLGLFICRKLMNAMDGDIFAQISDGEMQVTAVFRKS